MFPDPIVSLNSVIRELKIANDMSFSGCVIHVGKNSRKDEKNKKMKLEDAINEMKYYILWCIIHATPECPLLLETCCGCGTELLSDLYDFCDFYNRVVEDFPGFYEEAFGKKPTIKCPFGVCVDFAHTFAADYLPMESLSILEEGIGVENVRLIHYNDSKECRGSRKDRHEVPGKGNIDIEELYQAYQYAIKHGIPMVAEWRVE
jgi:endonuclease IV